MNEKDRAFLDDLVAFANRNRLKSISIDGIKIELFEPPAAPISVQPPDFELPKEAQPPTGDDLLFWSSGGNPEETTKGEV